MSSRKPPLRPRPPKRPSAPEHLPTFSHSPLRTSPPSHVPTFSRSHLHTFTPSHVPTFSLSHLLTFSPSPLYQGGIEGGSSQASVRAPHPPCPLYQNLTARVPRGLCACCSTRFLFGCDPPSHVPTFSLSHLLTFSPSPLYQGGIKGGSSLGKRSQTPPIAPLPPSPPWRATQCLPPHPTPPPATTRRLDSYSPQIGESAKLMLMSGADYHVRHSFLSFLRLFAANTNSEFPHPGSNPPRPHRPRHLDIPSASSASSAVPLPFHANRRRIPRASEPPFAPTRTNGLRTICLAFFQVVRCHNLPAWENVERAMPTEGPSENGSLKRQCEMADPFIGLATLDRIRGWPGFLCTMLCGWMAASLVAVPTEKAALPADPEDTQARWSRQ